MTTNPTRRTLLRVGLLGGAVLAAGGIGIGLQSTAPTPLPETLQALSPRAYQILVALADTVCPGNGGSLPAASEIGVPSSVDTYVATLSPIAQRQIEQALGLLESPLAGLFLEGRIRPFTRLDPAQREAVLEGWRAHRLELLRSAYVALRNLVVTAYYVHPIVHAGIGYPGPPDYGQALAPAIQPVQPREQG